MEKIGRDRIVESIRTTPEVVVLILNLSNEIPSNNSSVAIIFFLVLVTSPSRPMITCWKSLSPHTTNWSRRTEDSVNLTVKLF